MNKKTMGAATRLIGPIPSTGLKALLADMDLPVPGGFVKSMVILVETSGIATAIINRYVPDEQGRIIVGPGNQEPDMEIVIGRVDWGR